MPPQLPAIPISSGRKRRHRRRHSCPPVYLSSLPSSQPGARSVVTRPAFTAVIERRDVIWAMSMRRRHLHVRDARGSKGIVFSRPANAGGLPWKIYPQHRCHPRDRPSRLTSQPVRLLIDDPRLLDSKVRPRQQVAMVCNILDGSAMPVLTLHFGRRSTFACLSCSPTQQDSF